jgi:hypothetical protein
MPGIALTSTTLPLDSEVVPRFGRATFILAMETDTSEWQAQRDPAYETPCEA